MSCSKALVHPPGLLGKLPQSPHLSYPAAQALPSQCHHCPQPRHSQLSLFLFSSSAPACLCSNQAAGSRQDSKSQHGRVQTPTHIAQHTGAWTTCAAPGTTREQSAQRKGPGEILAAGTIAISRHMSLQTSQKPRDGAGQQQKAHKTQDQVKPVFAKQGARL